MENLFDPLTKIGKNGLQAQNVSFCQNDSRQSVILYHPGEFAYFDGGLVALITDKSLAEEICKILLMYLFYSSKKHEIQIFQKIMQDSLKFEYESFEKAPKTRQTINFSIITKGNSKNHFNPASSKNDSKLVNLQKYFSSLGLDISFYDNLIEDDENLSNFDQASSFFQVNGNEKSVYDEITDEIDNISSTIVWNLED